VLYFAVKTVISALLIAAVSEIAKRSPLVGGLVASLPLLSLLAIVWLYADTRSVEQVSALSWSILLMILPSLLFLIALPLLLKAGTPFALAIVVSVTVTAAGYWGYGALLGRYGITF
jgi:hypothetical protein